MFDDSTPRWLVVFAVVVFVGTTVGLTILGTRYWSGPSARIVPPSSHEGYELDATYDELPSRRGQLLVSPPESYRRLTLPSRGVEYDVDIRGDVANVAITQVFDNPTDRTFHPVYEGPMPADAVVHGLSMESGDRVVQTNLRPDDEHATAEEPPPHAEILAEDRSEIVTQRAPDLEPGASMKVTLRYVHPLPERRGRYRLALPLSRGERDTIGANGASRPRSNDSALEGARISLDADLHASVPIQRLGSSTHPVGLVESSPRHWHVQFPADRALIDRNFRLWYELSGSDTRVGAHAEWDDKTERGYVQVRLEPPRHADLPEPPERELVVVPDRFSTTHDLETRLLVPFVQHLLNGLNEQDGFRIVDSSEDEDRFDGRAVPALPRHLHRARGYLSELSFEQLPPLETTLERALEPPVAEGTRRVVVVLTDTKDVDSARIAEILGDSRTSARIVALGLGDDLRDYPLRELADRGRGFYRTFDPDELELDRLLTVAEQIGSPVLSGIHIDWGELSPDAVTPRHVPDLRGGEAVRIYGRYREPGTYRIAIEGRTPDGSRTLPLELTLPGPDDEDGGGVVRLGWARHRIDDLLHRKRAPNGLPEGRASDSKLRQQMIDTAFRHSLATRWTSFVTPSKPPLSEDWTPPRERPTLGETSSGAAVDDASELSTGRGEEENPSGSNPAMKDGLFGPSPPSDTDDGGAFPDMSEMEDDLERAHERLEALDRRKGPLPRHVLMGEERAGRTSPGANDREKTSSNAELDIELFEAEADETLSADAARRILKRRRDEIRTCHAEHASTERRRYRMDVRVEFDPDGAPESVAIDAREASLEDSSLASCVESEVRDWSFPHVGDAVRMVRYRFEWTAE
jgi:Ca-activated chloride channel family protein